MPAKRSKEKRNIIRIVILAIVGIVAFLVSTYINIVGMRNIIQKNPDSSGIAIFSVREATNLTGKVETKIDSSTGKVVVEDIIVNAVPVIQLINSNWDRREARFSDFELDDYGNATFKDGYTMYCNGMYVYNVVFNSNFEKEILGHIKVGTDFDTIESKLGAPSFRRENCIGYKTREVYIFFYEDEISLYPNKKLSNKNLEQSINSYFAYAFEMGRTKLIMELKNNYRDFKIEESQDEDAMILTSIARQIVLKLYSDGTTRVELYNGYDIANDDTKEYIEKNEYIQKQEDLVDIVESERKSKK